MRNGLLWLLGVWFFSGAQLFAQPSPAPNSSETKQPSATNSSDTKTAPEGNKPANGSSQATTTSTESSVDMVATPRCWAQVDYLLWWVKNAPLPVPIITTGDPRVGFDPNFVHTVNTAGALGQPGTQVLFGANSINSPAFSGMRLTVGGWVDDEETFGADASGFVLEHRTKRFAVASDKTGNPPLYFPIFSASAGAERGVPIADPLRGFSGAVGVISTLQLWGAECNGIVTLLHNPNFELTVLAGFRYADLRENLRIYNTTTDLIFNNVTTLNDGFDTTNQFYGGQLGSRIAVLYDHFSLDVAGKLALGATHQAVDILGAISQAGPNPLVPPGLGTFPGGLFAQSTNIGHRSANQFAVLPSLEVKLGYDLSQRARLWVGYDLMYWSEVVRPGNQINHTVNLTQNAVLDPNGVGKLVGPAQPAPLFNRSDFWAQGLSLGVEFHY